MLASPLRKIPGKIIRRLLPGAARCQSTITINDKYLLTYTYVPNILELRAPFREEHFKVGLEQVQKGILQEAGALSDPVDGAVFVFKNCIDSDIEEFVNKDPYVKEGLVSDYSIRKWTVAIREDDDLS